jgi:hypothetical protein
MNREWIGIAADLTEDQVVGAPYRPAAPAAAGAPGYPQPPSRGRLKTVAAIGALVALAAWFQPWPHGDGAGSAPERGDADAQHVAPPAAAAPAAAATAPGPAPMARRERTPHRVDRRPAAPGADAEPGGDNAVPANPPAGDASTEINLDHYRSLTRGL